MPRLQNAIDFDGAILTATIAPATHTVAVLLGRDMLKKGAFLFDGDNSAFSLWF
jgi:hypothetical protein